MGLRDRLLGKRTPEHAFTAEVSAVVEEMFPGAKIESIDTLTLSVTYEPGAQPATLFLHNAFAESRLLATEERGEHLRQVARAGKPAEPPGTWEAAAARLMPAVRAASVVPAGPNMRALLTRPFVPFLVTATAVDSEYAMTYVAHEDLDEWGVDVDAVEATARANFSQHGVAVDWEEGEPWVQLVGPDGYASSWLTRPDALAQAAAKLGGEFVVLVPSRDLVLLVATADRTALQAQLDAVLKLYEDAPRKISPVPYRVDGDRIVAWEPAPDDRCFAAVRDAGLALAWTEYGYQETALQEQLGDDVYVARFDVGTKPGAAPFSWCVWAEPVTDALLPRTDIIAFVESGDDSRSFMVRFEDAERIVPDLLRVEDDYDPQRWRTRNWPDVARLDELRGVAVDPDADSATA